MTATVVSLVFLSLSMTAAAVEHHPTGEFAPFADCPLSNLMVDSCLLGRESSGEFVVGRRVVPITKAITLSGGFFEIEIEGQGFVGFQFVGAENGETLSRTPLAVPGGLLGLIDPALLPRSLQASLASDDTAGVTFTAELAGPASSIVLSLKNLLNHEGIALSLPAKVKLSNPFLGPNCYIGSNTKPLLLGFTTGITSPPLPNRSIGGQVGETTYTTDGLVLTLQPDVLVNNSYMVPQAEGCGGVSSALIDHVIDIQLGLPSPAGHNTAVLQGTFALGTAEIVRESE